MNQCIKYLRALNLLNLANHLVGNNFTDNNNSNAESDFQQLFKWRSMKYGFQEAKIVNKPIFLLVHKLQCPSCQKLKQKFAKSVRLMDLSDRFVMINAEMGHDEILNESKFQPDGKYVPRILFFTSDGELIEEAYNKHANADDEYKYFYKTPSQIVETMLYVLKKYSNDPLPVIFQHEQPLKPESCDLEDDIPNPTLLH